MGQKSSASADMNLLYQGMRTKRLDEQESYWRNVLFQYLNT